MPCQRCLLPGFAIVFVVEIRQLHRLCAVWLFAQIVTDPGSGAGIWAGTAGFVTPIIDPCGRGWAGAE